MKKLLLSIMFYMLILGLLYYGVGLRIVYMHGESMLPTISNGQLALAITCNNLNENDIGIYRDPKTEKYVNHRVIYKTGSGYIFKGDNNKYFDDFVPKEWVEYKIIRY